MRVGSQGLALRASHVQAVAAAVRVTHFTVHQRGVYHLALHFTVEGGPVLGLAGDVAASAGDVATAFVVEFKARDLAQARCADFHNFAVLAINVARLALLAGINNPVAARGVLAVISACVGVNVGVSFAIVALLARVCYTIAARGVRAVTSAYVGVKVGVASAIVAKLVAGAL
jgi:hypothetical protein